MKKFLKFMSLTVSCLFVIFCIIGCSPQKKLKKISKGLSNYSINAKVDAESMSVKANQEVEFVNCYDVSLDYVCFNLYANAFRENAKIKPFTDLNKGKCFPNGESFGEITINEVFVSNKKANYSLIGEDLNALKVEFFEQLEPKERLLITINFELNIANCVHRLGYYKNNINLGNWFPILAIYEKGEFLIEPYYSTGDPFFSDIANYKVEFTYPEKYLLHSSGEEKTNKIESGLKKDVISASAVRDFAVFLTENSEIVSKKVNKTDVKYIGYKNDEDLNFLLEVASKAVLFFSKNFGEYPYKSLEIVKAPFLHGGMEYPGVVIISDNIENEFDKVKVIVHEIAHQWWYAVVGNNEVDEAWLDEALSEYSTILFLSNHKEFDVTYEELISEAFANYTLFADILSSVNKKVNTSMLLRVNEYQSEYEYTYMIYVRGVLMFDSINQIIGNKKLVNVLKTYFKKYQFKIASTDDFIAMAKKVGGKNIDVVLDSWLKGKTVIGAL